MHGWTGGNTIFSNKTNHPKQNNVQKTKKNSCYLHQMCILTMLPHNLVEKTNMVCTCRSREALGYQVHLLRSLCVLWSIPKSEYFANTIHV